MVCLEEGMGLDLLKSQPIVVVNHEDFFNQVLQFRTDSLAFGERVLASLDFFQRFLDRPPLKRTEFVLQSIENDSDSPHIRGERITKPTYCFRSDIIGSSTSLAFQLSGVGQLAGKPKIPQLDLVLRIQVKIAEFEAESLIFYSRCSMFLEWM